MSDRRPATCICTNVKRVARVLSRVYDAACVDAGMNITQLAVMRAVLRHPDEPLSRVADDLAMDRTSLYRALDTLERKHWLRQDAGSDSRSRRVSITKKGEGALASVDPAWEKTQSALLDRFGRAQWQSLVAELQRLADCAGGDA